jgi:hypothetical protein
MSNDENKKRFSARVTNDTLDEIEEYQHEHGLDNRSAAIEHLVEYREEVEQTTDFWELVKQQAMYAVTLSLTVATISVVSFVFALVLVGYPSPWTFVSAAVFLGSLIAALGGGYGYRSSAAKTAQKNAEVDA